MIFLPFLTDQMWGFQDTLWEEAIIMGDHPDREEMVADELIAMTPLAMLAPQTPSACYCNRCIAEGANLGLF